MCVCVCVNKSRILSHTAAHKMLRVWQPADSLTLIFTHWRWQRHHTLNVYVGPCACWCIRVRRAHMRGGMCMKVPMNLWSFSNETLFPSLFVFPYRGRKNRHYACDAVCVMFPSSLSYLSSSFSPPLRYSGIVRRTNISSPHKNL